jgi:N-acetylglucosamine kinase-like BadF-type ATPase
MNVVLGIDGGGTRTRASVVAGERLLAHAQGGSIKRLRVGAEAAEANLRALLVEVYAQSGVTGVRAASVGVASASMPGVKEWITEVLQDFGAERSEVVGDEVIALDAAFRGGPGILQIAGTGSNTIGRAPDGNLERAGGWSSRLGDEGSGYWIGVQSLRRALAARDRAFDDGEPAQILLRVGEIWRTPSLDDLVNRGNGTPEPNFAALSPAIHELAQAGDPVAVEVLQQAAADLVEFVLLVRSKLRRRQALASDPPVADLSAGDLPVGNLVAAESLAVEFPVAEFSVAWTGGVLEHMPLVRAAFFAGLRAAAPRMPIAPEPVVSLEGALWRAQRLAEETG